MTENFTIFMLPEIKEIRGIVKPEIVEIRYCTIPYLDDFRFRSKPEVNDIRYCTIPYLGDFPPPQCQIGRFSMKLAVV